MSQMLKHFPLLTTLQRQCLICSRLANFRVLGQLTIALISVSCLTGNMFCYTPWEFCVPVRPQLLDSMVRFSADSSKMGPTKIKKHQNHFIFLYPPDSDISLELLVPQKWFTYQYLQYLTRNTAEIEFKGLTQKIKW